jgi:Spy/CpxP family protein refolding chaperone
MKKAVLAVVTGLVVCLAFAYGAEAQMAGQKGMMKYRGAGMMGRDTPGCGMMQCGMRGDMVPGCGCGMMQCGMQGDMMPGRGMMGGGMMRGEMMGHRHHMMHMCLQHLGLSDKQRDEVEGIRTETMKTVIRRKADMQIAKIELRDLLAKDPVDMKAVEAKVKQIEGLKGDIKLALIGAKVKIRSKLTPEQRQKLTDMMGRYLMTGAPTMESSPWMGGADEEMEMQSPLEKQDEGQPESEQMEQMQ